MFGVIFGGPTPEHDISILTGLQAVQELSRGGKDVAALYWTCLLYTSDAADE